MTTPADTRQAMMELLELMAPVREAVLGYRASLMEDGWNETEAQMMAMQFHGYLITKMCSS